MVNPGFERINKSFRGLAEQPCTLFIAWATVVPANFDRAGITAAPRTSQKPRSTNPRTRSHGEKKKKKKGREKHEEEEVGKEKGIAGYYSPPQHNLATLFCEFTLWAWRIRYDGIRSGCPLAEAMAVSQCPRWPHGHDRGHSTLHSFHGHPVLLVLISDDGRLEAPDP